MKTNLRLLCIGLFVIISSIHFTANAQSYVQTNQFPFQPTSLGFAVDNTGNFVYVLNQANGTIQKFNSSNGAIINQWSGPFINSSSLAVDGVGNVYTTDGNMQIMKFTNQGAMLMTWSGPFIATPTAIASDGGNFIYALGGNMIYKFDLNGLFINQWPIPGGGSPYALAADISGNVYAGAPNSIIKFNSSGAIIQQWGTPGAGPGQFTLPFFIAVDQSSNVYVSDMSAAPNVQKFTAGGTFLSLINIVPPTPNNPYPVAVNSTGTVYVADLGMGVIKTYSPGSGLTCSTNSTSYCQGSSMVINYTASSTYNAGNVFTIQLSNSTGSFASPTTLGTVTGTTSGSFTATIPAATASGASYRVRVVASNPATTGTDNGANITIGARPAPVISGVNSVCAGQTQVAYTVTSNAGSTYAWTVPAGVTISSGAGTSSVKLNFGSTAGTISVVETNAGCTSTAGSLAVSIKPGANNSLLLSGPATVCGQDLNTFSVTNPTAGATYNWTVPTGATISAGAGTSTVSVKWGTGSGNISVSETNTCGTGTATSKVVTSLTAYSLGSLNAFCGTSFNVALSTVGVIKNGLIGLDYVINYDATKITPSGVATKGTVATSYGTIAINTATAGKLYVSVYLTNAPSGTFFSGTGDIAYVSFNVIAGVPHGTVVALTTDGIEESTPISSVVGCKAVTGNITIGGVTGGKLLYRNITNNPLIYNPAAPSAYVATTITGTSTTCLSPSIDVVLPDLNGVFGYNSLNGANIKIQRDILGDASIPTLNCSNVQDAINSADFIKASQIANYSYTPTIFELISSDVNLDGKVTSGDASLISSRSVNANNCEFPQVANYTWNGTNYVPNATYTKSIDWLFLDDVTLNTAPFKSGWGRNKVPAVPSCLTRPAGTPACSTIVGTNYYAVLLGDVNGNWLTSNGAKMKTAVNRQIILDLENVITTENSQLIPIYYTGDNSFSGMDFSIDHSSDIKVNKIVSNNLALNAQWNDISKQRLMVTASLSEEVSSDKPVAYLEIQSDKKVSSSDFSNASGYLNGEKSNIAFKQSMSTQILDFVNIFPNPSNSLTYIIAKDEAPTIKLSIYNINGRMVFENEKVPSNSDYSLPSLESGIYYISITGSKGTITKKLIRY